MAYYYLKEDITYDITINNYVTLCLNGNTLTGISTSSESNISVSSGAYFNLCDCSETKSGTIAGGGVAYGGGVYVTDATFKMYAGIIKGVVSNYNSGGISLTNSTFTMYDGTISNNVSNTAGGGVGLVNSTFTMYDGTISNNEANQNGGGVHIDNDSTFTMYDGTIAYNEAANGGGVNVVGTFNMYDGTIAYNEATNGGGVFLGYYTIAFNMYGGTITNNTATTNGGGVFVQSNGFTMYEGSISSNSAGNEGGGVYTSNNLTFDIYGGTISDNGIYVNAYITFNVYGGYINSITATWGGPIIKGGYFSETAYSSIASYIDTDYIGVNISTLGTDLDDNYVEGYPYAVYIKSSSTYQIENVTVSYGTSYTPTITGFDGNVTYTWVDSTDSNNTGTGLPSDAGEYTVTAYIFEVNTVDEETTISVATSTFTVTIS